MAVSQLLLKEGAQVRREPFHQQLRFAYVDARGSL